jgi:hypothetical protein
LAKKVLAESYKDTSRLAEIIHDYNYTLELRWIPEAKRGEEDIFPYVIVQNLPNGGEELVMYLTPGEVANPPGVLARLFNSDNAKHGKGGVLKRIEAMEHAQEIWDTKVAMEDMEERKDFWRSLWKSPLHHYRHAGKGFDL